jgi:hypothetical protein
MNARGVLANVAIEDRGYTSPCWVWQGALNHKGYGVCSFNGRWARVHRAMFEERVGPIPSGLQIDHLCRVKACCNPAHLEAVTCAENMLRRWRGYVPAATHCAGGHEWTAENTVLSREGWRTCRICVNAARRRRRARAKVA